MYEFTLSYREVFSELRAQDPWKEIILTTGGTQSTLQDIKAVERANGYAYEDSSSYHTRNRFIYWRINYDVLEIIEHSLEVNLTGNKVKYRFAETPILDGISIIETATNVVILVPTVCSVHRLEFPHPRVSHGQDDCMDDRRIFSMPSIFANVPTSSGQHPKSFYVFNHPVGTSDQVPHLASSYLCPDTKRAYFVLAYPSGELLLVKQGRDGSAESAELKTDSLMPRFLSGIADKFRPRGALGDMVDGVLLLPVGDEVCALSLCRDGRLKLWSCARAQCTAVFDVLEDEGETVRARAQEGILRKPVDATDSNSPLLMAYMSFPDGGQFFLLEIISNSQQIHIKRITKLCSPERVLIDAAVQRGKLWAVWRGEDGECSVFTAPLTASTFTGTSWVPVVLETPPDPEPGSLSEGGDIQGAYLRYLFHPGRFPLEVIGKALSVYKRLALPSAGGLSVNSLRQRICMAIEKEIEDSLQPEGADDETYLEHVEWCWQRFYSCCVQYHAASLKPLGLLLMPSVSAAILLKKSSFSFIRPMEPVEHMLLCNGYTYQDQIINFALVGEDNELVSDILLLFDVMAYVEQQFSEGFLRSFEAELCNGQSPDDAIQSLMEKIQYETEAEFMAVESEICTKTSQCDNLYAALHKILEWLRPSNIDGDSGSAERGSFTSDLGVALSSGVVRQQARTRFIISRDLLLICHCVLRKKELEASAFGAIQSVCYPELISLTKANYVVMWLCSLTMLADPSREGAIQRLAPIKLPRMRSVRPLTGQMALLERFVAGAPLPSAGTSAQWHLSLLEQCSNLRKLLWPLKPGATVPAWLLANGQHIWLQQFASLAGDQCDTNGYATRFLVAASLLSNGEPRKALELFLSVAEGAAKDPFLQQHLMRGSGEEDPRSAYYTKVIQLLELHRAADCAAEAAAAALNETTPGSVTRATLRSAQFKHQLRLRRFGAAFDALRANPDAERRRDNLRDLVKTLLDEGRFDELLKLPASGLDEQMVEVLMARARAAPATDGKIYDLLYAYHVRRGPLCHRLAASVMYEQACRLGEARSALALERQAKCYLAAANALRLCGPDHAWVAIPANPEAPCEEIYLEPPSGTEEEPRKISLWKQVEVVGLETIRKDVAFASARLKLAKFDAEMAYNVTTPEELFTGLVKFGLYEAALKACRTFDLPPEPAIEALTEQCVRLTEGEADQAAAWEWFVENDLQDLPPNRDVAADVAWQLLHSLLNRHEADGDARLHLAVCQRLVVAEAWLPEWLVAACFERGAAAALLRLLHAAGRLRDAAKVALDALRLPTGKPLIAARRLLGESHLPASDRHKLSIAIDLIVRSAARHPPDLPVL